MKIDFLDPDAPKKRRYQNYLRAIRNFLKNNSISATDMKLVAKFFERKQLNREIRKNPNRVQTLNLIGWVRTLFRLQPFEQAHRDLRSLGLNLEIQPHYERKIRNEYRRRNRPTVARVDRSVKSTPVVVIRKKR